MIIAHRSVLLADIDANECFLNYQDVGCDKVFPTFVKLGAGIFHSSRVGRVLEVSK